MSRRSATRKRSKRVDATDMVNHPPHYADGLIEHVEYAESRGWAPGYHLGNATKYLHRAGKKPGAEAIEDLKKSVWYINRLIAWMEQGSAIWKITPKETKR
jgi:hypothetical protein